MPESLSSKYSVAVSTLSLADSESGRIAPTRASDKVSNLTNVSKACTAWVSHFNSIKSAEIIRHAELRV
jgi:hypothetical protein